MSNSFLDSLSFDLDGNVIEQALSWGNAPELALDNFGAPATPTPAVGGSRLFDDGVIWQESRGRQFDKHGRPLTSSAGAIGIAQVMPGTAPEAARYAGLEYDERRYRNDPEYNAALGRAYFNKQLETFGDEAMALAAYNAGPGNVQRAIKKANASGNPDAWLNYLPAETRDYVPKILGRVQGGSSNYAPPVRPAATAGNREDTSGSSFLDQFSTEDILNMAQAGSDGLVQGVAPLQEKPSNPDFFRGVADTALAFGQGAVGSVKTLTDLAGAGNAVSGALDDVSKWGETLKSQESQQARKYHQQKIKEAEASGDTMAEIGAYVDMVWDMPAESLAQGIGSFATLGAGKAAQVFKLASAAKKAGMTKEAFLKTAQGVDAAKAASNLGARVNLGLGIGQGVGGVKGAQYEQAYNAAKEKGLPEDEARNLASQAQSYEDGWGQQALGAALGYVAGKTGPIEKVMSGQTVGVGGITRRAVGGFATEGVTEGLQGAQERYAGNDAAIDAGVLDESKRYAGVAGSGVSEGLVGGVIGGGMGAMGRPDIDPVTIAAQQPNSPLSRAAVAAGATQPPAAPLQQTPAAPIDELTQRATAIEAIIQGDGSQNPGLLSQLAALDDDMGTGAQGIIELLETAKNPDADLDARQTALAALEAALRMEDVALPAAQQAPAGTVPAPITAQTQPVDAEPPLPTYMPGAEVNANREKPKQPRVLQPRQRDSAASVAQMMNNAKNIDWLQVGPSSVLGVGAPVVFGDLPQNAILGDEQMVTDMAGRHIATRYAIVDASDVIASNTIDGNSVRDYETGLPGKLRAAAGNGRKNAIEYAYDIGTAQNGYLPPMLKNAPSLGIQVQPQALSAMSKPMLVRIMDESDVTDDFGAVTNAKIGLDRSDVEQAADDARAFNFGDMDFDESGAPTDDSIGQFIAALPTNETGNLVTKDDRITPHAVSRFMAATFKHAYEDDALVGEVTMETDPSAKRVLDAAMNAAGVMAALKGTGEFDVSLAVADAIRLAVNAKRQGFELANMAQNQDIAISDEGRAVARMLGSPEISGSSKKMAAELRRWGMLALHNARIAEQNRYQGGLIEPTPTLTREEIFAALGSSSNPTEQAVTGRKPPEQQQAEAPAAQAAAEEATSQPQVQRQPDEDGLQLNAANKPFSSEGAAKLALRKFGQGQVVPVEGGFAIQLDGTVGEMVRGTTEYGFNARGVQAMMPKASQTQAPDIGHLSALEVNLSHERQRLAQATTDQEREARQVWVQQLEKEVAGEREFLGLPVQPATATDIGDDELLAELGGDALATAPPEFASFEAKMHLLRSSPELVKADGSMNERGIAIARTPWSELSQQDRALAIGLSQERRGANDASNAIVREQEFQAERRRMQGDLVIQQASGKPFKNEASAKARLDEFDLADTHAIEKVDGGFVLGRMSDWTQSERKRKAEGRESYTEAQAAVMAEMGIGETADGEIDATDEQFMELERRTALRLGRVPPKLSFAAPDAALTNDDSKPTTPQQTAAIERVNAGKAVFLPKTQAEKFIADNNLADTHEIVKDGKAHRVQAKAAQAQATQQAEAPTDTTAGIKQPPPQLSDEEQIANAVAYADELGLVDKNDRADAIATELAFAWGMAKDEILDMRDVQAAIRKKPSKEAKEKSTERFVQGVMRQAAQAKMTPELKDPAQMLKFLDAGGQIVDRETGGKIIAIRKTNRYEITVAKTGKGKPIHQRGGLYMASSGSMMRGTVYPPNQEAELLPFLDKVVSTLNIGLTTTPSTKSLVPAAPDIRRSFAGQQAATTNASTPAATIRAAISKAYGKLLGQLESKGLVTLAQTEAQAIDAAAQARADKTGGDVAQIKRSLAAAMQGGTALGILRSANDSAQQDGMYSAEARLKAATKRLQEVSSAYAGKPEQDAELDILEPLVKQLRAEVKRLQSAGRPAKLEKPADHELEAQYDSPDDIPANVRSWLRQNLSIITSDATDAVRWMRIEGTLKNERYPDEEITIYRAVDGDEIRPGDWVTTERQYAEDHLRRYLHGKGVILEQSVNGADVLVSPTGNMEEAIYAPREFSGAATHAGLDVKRSTNGAVQGFFDPQTGQSFLIADNLSAEAAPGVLMHEVGIHMAADGSMKALFSRAKSLMRNNKDSHPAIKAAWDKMQAAGETSAEEAAAYLVEAYENDRAKAPASVRKWMLDILAAVKAWLHKKGIVGAGSLTVADIAAVARANAKSMARGDAGGGVKFSRAEAAWRARWSESRITDLLGRYAYTMDAGRTQAYAATISPNEFLDATTPPSERAALEAESTTLDEERLAGERQPIMLEVRAESEDGEFRIVGHEGRHRMVALRNAGIESVPVVIVMRDGPVDDAKPMEDLYFAPQVWKSEGAKAKSGIEVRAATPINHTYADEVQDRFGRPPGGDAVMFSRAPQWQDAQDRAEPAPSTWQAPEATKWDEAVYNIQDKNIDTKRVQQAIEANNGQLSDDLNVRQREEMFSGRSAKEMLDFKTQEQNPMLQQLGKDGIELADFEQYLHARHAPEANKLMAERNPNQAMINAGRAKAAQEISALAVKIAATTDKTQQRILKKAMSNAMADLNRWNKVVPYSGSEESRLMLSGMSDAQAKAIMDALSPQQRAAMQRSAAMFDAIVTKNRALMADYELESKDTVDSWAKMFQHYVPLMREEPEGSLHHGMGTGEGFSVKGREVKSRTGSTRKVVDIVANLAMQREKTIVRGEKNRVTNTLIDLAKAHPNPDFWKVGAPDKVQKYDPDTRTVKWVTDPLYKSRENVIVGKRLNDKGQIEEVALTFEKNDPRAMRMAVALKNLDDASLNKVLQTLAPYTRALAALSTQYNPVWGAFNFLRDTFGVMISLGNTPLTGQNQRGESTRLRIYKDAWAALPSLYRGARAERKGQEDASEWGSLWEDLQKTGGAIGFRDMLRTGNERSDLLKSVVDPDAWMAWMETSWGKALTLGGTIKPLVGAAKRGGEALFNWISDFNLALENATRVAVYKAGLEKGLSKERAASIAKNITVNFNRRGAVGHQIGAAYAFFNASVQGTARMAEAMTEMSKPGDPRSIRLTEYGRNILLGSLAIGALQAVALAAAGFGDDEPPEFVRDRNIIIPTGKVIGPEKGYITVPLPLGYNVIPSFSRRLVEFAMSGGKDPFKHLSGLLELVFDGFNPVGSGSFLQTLAPTVLDPVVAGIENKDSFGRPIARETLDTNVPAHTLSRSTATAIARWLSEGLNYISGGDDYTAGKINVSPDQLDYAGAQYLGGVGREIMKVWQSTTGFANGEDVPLYKIPFAGRLAGNAGSTSAQANAYYTNQRELDKVEKRIDGLREDGKAAEAIRLHSKTGPYLLAQAKTAEREVRELRKAKAALLEKNASREQVARIEQRMTAAMRRLNEAVARQKERSSATVR